VNSYTGDGILMTLEDLKNLLRVYIPYIHMIVL